MFQAKVTTVGNLIGIMLPKEVTNKLHIKKGDKLYLCETPGGYTLTPYNEEFIRQMRLAEKIMHNERNVLKVLASS